MQYELTHELTLIKKNYFVHGVLSEENQVKPGDFSFQNDSDTPTLKIHCGKKDNYNPTQLKKRLFDVVDLLNKQSVTIALIAMPKLSCKTADEQLQLMIRIIEEKNYQLNEFKSSPIPAQPLEKIIFYLDGATNEALSTGKAIADGMNLTRYLANLPANVCTPSYLAEAANLLSKEYPKLIKTRIWDKEAIEKFEMGGLLAVSQGSYQEPRFIEIHYTPRDKYQAQKSPIVLAGKGVTFDAGGISLKPGQLMNEMKYDMAGAASVLGTIKACAELEVAIPIIGLIPATENMPGGGALKPGDIIKSMSGQTIEILNTDAEGRLILADVLTYAERFQPQFVLDIATLTGAIIIALGSVNSGLMTTDDELASHLIQAGITTEDKIWRMPLESDYQDSMDSPIADMVNAQFDRSANSITAACFLSRFTKNYRWAHLDIAGTAWVSGTKRQATGRPVPLLVQWLRYVANQG